jgi:CheY-like chemotaxis protein
LGRGVTSSRAAQQKGSYVMRTPQPGVRLVVAVVNTNDDLVSVIRDALIVEGFSVVTAHIRDIKAGRQDFSVFLREHDPGVVIYDIAIPYEDNWTFLQTLRQLPEAEKRRFILTTVNKRVLDQRIGPKDVIELQGGRADDLDPLLERVKKETASLERRLAEQK